MKLSSSVWRNALLWVCVVLPWLNPFTSPPSASVLPLLVSWMMSACALLLLADLPVTGRVVANPPANERFFKAYRMAALAVVLGVCASLLWVPPVIDVGLSAGLLAACTCVALMVGVGRRLAHGAPSGLVWLAAAWLGAALISSVLGLLQYLDLASGLSPWVNQPAFKGDAFANLRQRNQFASLTSIGWVSLLALCHVAWCTPHVSTARRVALRRASVPVAFVLLNLLAVGAACSMSRTAVLQWCSVTVLALLWAWRQRTPCPRAWWVLVVGAPVYLLLWSFAMPLIAQQVSGQAGANLVLRVAGAMGDYGACGSRSVLWANVWQLILQRPLWGWGWGETDLAHFLTLYPGQRFCDILDNAHNLPLHLALEMGLPLALALLLLAGVWVWLRRPWREHDVWRVMAWGVLWVIAVHSVLEYPLWYGPFQMAVGLSLGVLWVLPGDVQTSRANKASHKTNEATALLLASTFFLACLYAAWDYQRVSQIYKPVEQRDARYQDNPLAYAKQSWLFANQALFAELTLQQVDASNAPAVYALAHRVVHYSPEPRVVQRLIDSARLLGHDDEADAWQARLTAHQQAVQR